VRPCRTGTQQMHGLLDKIAKAEASHADLALLEELCEVVQATSLCGLGQTAPNPVLSTLRYFRHEYEEKLCGVDHVRMPYRSARYGVDSSHEMFRVDHNRCVLCTRCVRVCDEIEGAHTWDVMGRGSGCQVVTDLAKPWGDSASCTSCGKCVQVCPTGALVQQGTSVGEMVKDQSFLSILARRRSHR
jgi:ferredoxin